MTQLCLVAPTVQFDDLFNELDIVATHYDITQIQSLSAFVTREKTLNQMEVIVFDLEDVNFSQEHILSAVQLLRRFSIARLVFISHPGAETSELYGKLAQTFRVSDLITTGGNTNLQWELRSCLTEEEGAYHRRLAAVQTAMTTEAAQVASPLAIPPGLTIQVVVSGSMSRVGTTTQAFALYHYLLSLGFRPAILDPMQTMRTMLCEFYPDKVKKGQYAIIICGIPFCAERNDDFDAYIQDLGVLDAKTAAAFAAADVSVLVGGTKPWELGPMAAALKLLVEPPRHQVSLLSFSTKQDVEGIKKYLGQHYAAVPYHPELWTPGSAAALKSTILPCLKQICGDKQ